MPSADTAMPDQRSPSPPAQPPVALTPGVRAEAFNQLYDKTLKKTMTTISYDKFAECFPSIDAKAPKNLAHYHKATIEQMDARMRAEFEDICRDRNVVYNLNSLEDIIADAKRRKDRGIEGEEPPVPPHLLGASAIQAAHLAPHLTSTQSQLNAKLQTIQSQNASLAELLQSQEKEITTLMGTLEGLIKGVDGAVDGLNKDVDDIAAETRDIDSEIRAL